MYCLNGGEKWKKVEKIKNITVEGSWVGFVWWDKRQMLPLTNITTTTQTTKDL